MHSVSRINRRNLTKQAQLHHWDGGMKGWAGDSGANVRGSDLFSSPAVPGKCRACDITQIYPRGIYYYKEQGYDSQQVPAVQDF